MSSPRSRSPPIRGLTLALTKAAGQREAALQIDEGAVQDPAVALVLGARMRDIAVAIGRAQRPSCSRSSDPRSNRSDQCAVALDRKPVSKPSPNISATRRSVAAPRQAGGASALAARRIETTSPILVSVGMSWPPASRAASARGRSSSIGARIGHSIIPLKLHSLSTATLDRPMSRKGGTSSANRAAIAD